MLDLEYLSLDINSFIIKDTSIFKKDEELYSYLRASMGLSLAAFLAG
jgi:hypothetical protein